MAERNIDPGGGSVEPHDNQSPRNGEKGSDQRHDVGAQPPEVGFSVPEASVKLEKEGGMKKAPNETKSDSPLSHQVSLEQSEAKQKPQPVAQKWTVPLSRFIPKRKQKTSSTQDSVQPSPKRNKRSEKKKRYKQNKKKRKELEARQHQDDQSKSSVKGDTPPASDNEMEFDDAQQEQEETSHNTAFSSESQDQEEQTSKNDTLQCETAVMVPSDSSHVVQDSRRPLETKGENKIPSVATSGPEGNHRDIQGGSVPPLEPIGASETQPGSPQKETEKNAAAVSSGIALQEQEKVFGKGKSAAQNVQAGIVSKAAVQKPEAANLSVKNGDKSHTANDLSTDGSSYSPSMVCDAAGSDQNEGKLCETIVILHAFIDPAHWGKTDKDLMVEVRSDLVWTKNSATNVHLIRLVGGSVLAVESTIMLPHNVKFPFGYKYYVCVSAKAKDCYEHLSPPARCNSIVNRCIRGTNYLVPGMQGNIFHHFDDLIVPKSTLWRKFLSTLGIGSDSDERNIQLLNHGIKHHLDSKSDLLIGFVSGKGAADQLIEHIVSVCRHVNDHCVLTLSKQDVFCCRQADVQKIVVQWTLKVVKTMTETSQLNQHPVSRVEELQVIGLVAIAIIEAVHPENTHSNLSTAEVEEVAQLLCYRSIPLDKVEECQAVVCKYLSTMRRDTIQTALQNFIMLLARQMKITMILDGLLLLTSWCDMDFNQCYFSRMSSFVDSLQCAFSTVLAKGHGEYSDEWLAISLSNVEYLDDKCFSQFVLRIVPLKCWAAVAMYVPLQILFQCLDEHLGLRRNDNLHGLSELLNIIVKVLQDPSRMDRMSKELGAIGALGWRITEHIMNGSYDFAVKTSAIHFYLTLCGVVIATGDHKWLSKLPCLIVHMEDVIKRRLQHCGIAFGLVHKFGGGDGTRFGIEFGIWVGLLTPMYPASVESDWHKVCDLKLSERLSKLSFELQLEALSFCNSHNPPEALVKIFLNTAVNEFSKCSTSQQEKHLQGEQDWRIQKVFTEFTDRRYRDPDMITLHDLCTWSLWPCYFKLASTCEGLKHSPAFLVASELLQTTAKSINEETITVEEVQVITNDPYIQQNLEQMLGLLPSHKGVTDQTAKKLQIAKSELVTFEKERSQLVSLTTRWHRHIGPKDEGEWREIQERCQRNVESLPVAKLQHLLWTPPASKALKNITNVFAALFDEKHTSGILQKIWDAVCPRISSLRALVEDLWPKFVARVNRVSAELLTLNITCADAASLLHSEMTKDELHLLEQALRNSGILHPPVAFSPEAVQDKLLLFENMLKVHVGAENLLELRNSVEFTGDFDAVESIARCAEVFGQQPLRSLDPDNLLRKVVDFLMNLSCQRFCSLQACLCGIRESSELVRWLRNDVQDVGQLQNFTNIALISLCEDGTTADLIKALEVVGTKLAPFIYHLKPTAGISELIDCCKQFRMDLDDLEGVSHLLGTCRDSLEVYKSIQRMLSSVETTTFSQIQDVTNNGEYIVMAPEGKIPSTISDLINVVIKGSGAVKTAYSLDDLKDLQSKLALIRGNITDAKIQHMATAFWQGLEVTVRLADALLRLLLVGHVKYSSFRRSYFHLAQPSILKTLEQDAKCLEADLEQWNAQVKKLRAEFYEVNYFTSRQLSLICQQLSVSTDTNSLTQPWFHNLMLSIHPHVRAPLVLRAAKRIAADKERTDQRTMLGLQAYSEQTELAAVVPDNADTRSESDCRQSLTVDDLDETAKDIFDYLTITQEYFESIVLCGLAEFGPDLNAVEMFCLQSGELEIDLSAKSDAEHSLQVTVKPSSPAEVSTEHPLVAKMVDQAFPVDLILKAVEMFGDDEDKVFQYCLSEEENNMIMEQAVNVSPLSHGPRLSSCAPVKSTLPVCIPALSAGFWELKEVGQFLELVSSYHQEEATADIQPEPLDTARAFPSMFETGSPNLVVVPRADLYSMLLSVYKESDALPLPTMEEVLLCHSSTSAEDIHLLWRRAMCDPGYKRIFCLVCEHNLSYKIAKEVVQSLGELSQGHRGFRIVIVCCREDEGSSLLVSDLRDYKRSPYPLRENAEIRDYLRKHFMEDAGIACQDVECVGASVDPESSCVRVVTSTRAGMGKSLYVNRLVNTLEKGCSASGDIHHIVTLHGPDVSIGTVIKVLSTINDDASLPTVLHLDVSDTVIDDIGSVLFSMLVLRGMQDSEGNVWRCSLKNLLVVEVNIPELNKETERVGNSLDLLLLLPTAKCLSPLECLHSPHNTGSEMTLVLPIGMDITQLRSEPYQRVYHYLSQGKSVDAFTYSGDRLESDDQTWIQLILSHFKLPNPSWREVSHFVQFLNFQLEACEHSVYCQDEIVGDHNMDVVGFKNFVVKFMIRMSVDFTVPSLKFETGSGYTRQIDFQPDDLKQDLEGYQIDVSRAWDTSYHPYIFFNRDWTYTEEVEYDSMTFVGFKLQQEGRTIHLLDLQHQVIEQNIMSCGLYQWLRASKVDTRQDPDAWSKKDILRCLSRVMENSVMQDSLDWNVIDPDPSYALTYDNLLKMLAIQMRFRCNIPVVIIGETGCGKTRLVRYMCQLQAALKMNPQSRARVLRQTFFILKVHGGIAEDDIITFIKKVQICASENKKQSLETVVFFDEANTTDAIGLIKEIMCDRRMRGEQIHGDIKFIAACNPYRKHSNDMIERLESAGLGFFIRITETKQKLGDTPLRHLVYRVLDLPASMRTLVYDYGSLCTGAESVYIKRIVENHVNASVQDSVPAQYGLSDAITKVLSWCQEHMRQRKDECSYVSLRDIQRFMIVYKWFLEMHEELSSMKWNENPPDACTMAMILSLAVCYCSRLIDQKQFEEQVVTQFVQPFQLPGGVATFRRTVFSCQEAFLSNMVLGPNIARNAALRENVFMMAVCVELRIPLFVVGKPGSSKSLAKSIVAESMKGQNSKTDFLKKFKAVKLLTYQCSQLSTPESITHVFKTAQMLQQPRSKSDSNQGLSLVVLDEVGLAEDSPSFPLKALHPLLEDGTDGSDMEDKIVAREKRVAFIGISNWALDPAKMNRGLMVMRGDPGIDELVNSARGICSTEMYDPVRGVLNPILGELATGYLKIVSAQEGSRKEFFGLRDFYSLIKMLYWLIKNSGEPYQLTVEQLQHSILRNFGGSRQINPLEVFADCLNKRPLMESDQRMDCSPLGLIRASLSSEDISWHGENRYLLFLTENNAALEVMQNYLFQSDVKPYVLFGSSFPRDKDYTQVCRNINQIKICMETGRTVVLLNLENLYESLYDLLNQYYTMFLGSRYVDLGLQSHRIKCRVDEKFKLILIADMDKVYEKFPIPLINRLEKHIVTTSTILLPDQRQILKELHSWLTSFCTVTNRSFKDGDAFIGYQSQTAAAVVLHVSQTMPRGQNLLKTCKELLIQMACPDALARLKDTALQQYAEEIWDLYFNEQEHLCLSRLLKRQLQSTSVGKEAMGLLIQVTTHSLPLSTTHVKVLCSELKINIQNLLHLYIEELDTEADFTDRIRMHMSMVTDGDTYVLVQCSSGHLNKDLISCARHKAIDELENFRGMDEWKEEYVAKGRQVHVIFVVSLPKTPGGTTFAAFQGGRWLCVHLDDLRSPEATALTFMAAVKFPLSKLYTGVGGIALHKRLQGCLQAAIAQIPDSQTQDRGHKTGVLKTLYKAVGDGKDVTSVKKTFNSILVDKITPLLQEVEETQADVLGKDWALIEALDPHKLQEGGTFLNTLLCRIDGILTNLLSYIIEFIDQHNNLALFNDDRLQDLWLTMFQDDSICAFSYKSIHLSAEESKSKSLFQKLGSVDVGRYCCRMPFSWIILQAVEAQWNHSDLESGSDACQRLMSLYEKMEVQHIGAFFRDYPLETASHLQLHQLYLKDFIVSVIQSHNMEEAKVLETTMVRLSDQMLQTIDEVTLLHRLASYHVAYRLNEVHFTQYRALGSIFLDLHCLVVDRLSDGTAQAPSSTYIVEPLDVFAVRLLLERIAPKPLTPQNKVEFWNIQNLRNIYIKKLRECQTTVDGILQYSPCNTIDEATSLRVQWHSVRAVQIYIEHLILPLSLHDKMTEEIIKGAFRLWSALTRPGRATTFSRKDQLERFVGILRSVDDRVATHFGFRSPEDRRSAANATSSSDASYGDFCRAVKMLFLEVVSVLCFGQGSPTPELIQMLMKQVFQNQTTQHLTPLEWEENDSSPVIRSVLLQLILMGSNMEVDLGRLIESYITTCSHYIPGESQPELLYSLVIRCLEDTAYKAQSAGQDKRDIARSLEYLGNLLESAVQSYSCHNLEAPPTFKWLNDIAQLRFALALSADYLCTYVADTPEKIALKHRSRMMMEQFVDLLSACLQKPQLQDLSLYLAKQIARRHGMVLLKRLYQEHSFVLPVSLQQHQLQQNVPDFLVLSGDGYSELREALMQAVLDDSDQSFRVTLDRLPADCAQCVPLAVFAKLTWPTRTIHKTPDRELMEGISSSIQQCGLLDHNLTEVTLNLLKRQIAGGFTPMQPSLDLGARMLTALVLHVITAVFSKQRDPLLKPFVSILTTPTTMVGKFLPTMPEDFLVQAMTLMDMQGQYSQRNDMRGKFYSCPNGHPYVITECTGPNQSWNCPVCHQRIGALNSQLAPGNAATPLASRVEVGYILGVASSRSHEAIPERNMSPLACAVMRFILHACFMWSASQQPEAVLQSIADVGVGDPDVATFFWEHLLMDMRVLGRALSAAEDEVALYLHQIIARISTRQDVTGIDGSLASKAIRSNWEDHFCRLILDPFLQNPAAIIQKGLDVISRDAELEHDEVFLAVYEKTAREPDMMQTLWAYRTRITMQDMTAALNNVPDVKHKHPLLHKFLQEEPLLRALQYLPNVVQLQKVLVACLNHKIDRGEAQALTVGVCFQKITNSEEEQMSLVECLVGFRKAWKLVKERLPHHRIHITASDVQTMGDVSEDLPVACLLPCFSGPGLCSLALADFLLFQQNELIEHCAQSLSKYSCFSRKSIPLSQVQPFHMVSYEGEIHSVILTHCRYSLSFGKGHEVEYDFAALEKHIYDRFLVTKPEIDGRSQPLMMYTSDVIRQDIFQQLKDKIKPQIFLSLEEQRDVLGRLHNNLRHITEALSTVTTAMGFLASAGSCPDVSCALKDYILKVLKIRRTEFCANYTLQNILSLWETLALEKAWMHSLNGKEIPFDGYNDATSELFHSMPEEVERQYKTSLKGMPLNSLMSLLFQFIQVRLRTFESHEFKWPLTDCLQGYIPDCNDNNVQDLEEKLNDFPEDVLVEHAVHVWHITVRHHQDLLQNATSECY